MFDQTSPGEQRYLLDQLFNAGGDGIAYSLVDVFAAMTVSALLCFILAYVYRATHRGTSYSQSFLVSLIIMSVATSVVMVIIGSNIARAFSLVGALSIIRFRTAVKDTKDTAFLFTAIVAGMACGTGFYFQGAALTIFASFLCLALFHFDYGTKKRLESILRITLSEEAAQAEEQVEAILRGHLKDCQMIHRIRDFGDGLVTQVYIARPTAKTLASLEDSLKAVEGVKLVTTYETDQHAPF
jgi:uncharacterized membrane protein YhiD involved in acid resistance